MKIVFKTKTAIIRADFYFVDVINIGGAHIKSTKPLPHDIEKFIEGAEHGTIYFSMGTILQSSKMSKEKLNAIFSEFFFADFIQ